MTDQIQPAALRSGKYTLDEACFVNIVVNREGIFLKFSENNKVPILTSLSDERGWYVTYQLGQERMKSRLTKVVATT